MKLWILEPIGVTKESLRGGPWDFWYDKVFGFVVRAETEYLARNLAQKNGGDEIKNDRPVWDNPNLSTCIELTINGEEDIIMQDFHAA